MRTAYDDTDKGALCEITRTMDGKEGLYFPCIKVREACVKQCGESMWASCQENDDFNGCLTCYVSLINDFGVEPVYGS